MNNLDDTIVAIATPQGEGALGVIRVSGPKVLTIANEIFKPKNKTLCPSSFKTSHLYLGSVINDQNESVDDAMGCIFRAPHSYTGENSFEITCHGSVFIVKTILSLIISHGARLAEAGEFTKRAFLNGRLDLSQAEAVIDLIQAKTELQRKYALRQVQGELSKELEILRESIFNVMVETEANIDFPDYVPEGVSTNVFHLTLQKVICEIQKLLAGFQTRKLVKEGFHIILMGEPNVGKSSLLNALTGKELAIVTELPGTTRDAIEHCLYIKGIPIHFTDTAGLRKPENRIEQKGIEVTHKKFNEADLILWILDVSQVSFKSELAKSFIGNGKEALIVLNKSDLTSVLDKNQISQMFPQHSSFETSSLLGTGITELKNAIETWIGKQSHALENQFMINARHEEILIKACNYLLSAKNALENQLGDDLIASDLRNAIGEFDEILGKSVDEETTHAIFTRFCIGK